MPRSVISFAEQIAHAHVAAAMHACAERRKLGTGTPVEREWFRREQRARGQFDLVMRYLEVVADEHAVLGEAA